jgi:glycosyltransferase involved in cell wall biosynthesis
MGADGVYQEKGAMKPSILIFSQAMELGGVERSLLGLLDSIDYDRYDVDLFLMRHNGELMSYLNPKAKLLPEIPQYASLAVPMASLVRNGHLGVLYGRLRGKLAARRFDKQHPSEKPSVTALTYSHRFTLAIMPQISDKTYDLAISFLTPHYFARERVRAKKYAAWIHTDYTALSFDRSAELAMWNRFDAICGVSAQASESFQTVFPELAGKVQPVENILPRELTTKQAEQPQIDMPSDGAIKILSVGRFCNAKNFDNAPDICRRLVENGLNVKWYLIGYGGDEALIRQKIAEAGMQDRVIILGKKDNPYPYMRACDLYVHPSRYEGKAVTVREAQLLGKPVVITNYATSASQLEDGVDGVIVPMDNEGCAAGIAALLRDPARMQRLSESCAKRDYTNSAEVEKIYALMED